MLWTMGDSLLGVYSYSQYTPCFLRIGSTKVRALYISHLEGVQQSSKYCAFRIPTVQESYSTRGVNKGGKLDLNRSSLEYLQYDITDGDVLLNLKQLIMTVFIFVLSIAKESVPCGLGTFNSSQVNLNVLAHTNIYEEQTGYFFSFAFSFSNVFIFQQQQRQ